MKAAKKEEGIKEAGPIVRKSMFIQSYLGVSSTKVLRGKKKGSSKLHSPLLDGQSLAFRMLTSRQMSVLVQLCREN